MEEKRVDGFEGLVLDAADKVRWLFFLPPQHPTPERYQPVEAVGQNEILSVYWNRRKHSKNLDA